MDKLLAIFRPIDEYIFGQIDILKNSPQFQQALGKLDGLSDQHQKILYQVVSYLLVILPLFFIFIVFLGNQSVKSDIALREEIQSIISEFNNKKKLVQGLSRQMVSRTSVTSKADLQAALSTILGRINVGTGKINISNFQSNPKGDISRSSAALEFNGLSTTQLSDFLKGLLITEKMKIENIQINKNVKANTLDGKFNIIHFSKNSGNAKN